MRHLAKPRALRRSLAIAIIAALAAYAPWHALAAQQRTRTGDPVADYVRGLTSVTRLTIVTYSAGLKETVVSAVNVSNVSVALGRVDVTLQTGMVYSIPTDSVWYTTFDANNNTLSLYLRR